jgi:hypothetical protein
MRCACIEERVMLGDVLAALNDETTAVELLLNAGDLALLTAARERAAAEGIDLADCVTQTVQRYTAQASDEEWMTLMGLLNRSQDPGMACLKRAFAYVLRR